MGRRSEAPQLWCHFVHLDPSHENVRALIDRAIVGPVVMLNLLRFKTVADYSDHPALAPARPITGRLSA